MDGADLRSFVVALVGGGFYSALDFFGLMMIMLNVSVYLFEFLRMVIF